LVEGCSELNDLFMKILSLPAYTDACWIGYY